jgi:VanZ family protein
VSEQLSGQADRNRAKVFCIVAVLAVCVATLSPPNPSPSNGVSWLPGTGGIRFGRAAGLVTSSGTLRPAEAQGKDSYTLELLLRPASVQSGYTILGFYSPTRSKQLLVRQWKNGLLVTHDRTVESDRTQTIKFDVDHVFQRGKLVLVTISSGPRGTAVYLDGQPASSFPGFKIEQGELTGETVLGTSPVSYHPWSGELHGFAIYAKELTPAVALRHYQQWTDAGGSPDLDDALARYAFAEGTGREVHNEVASGPNLNIPATFSVPHKGLLLSPATEFKTDRHYAADALTNIAGFVPLGVIVCAYLAWTRSRWQAILITIAACGTLSFMIEVLQYFIPRRGSGITDIITNTLGAVLGAVLTQVGPVRRILTRMKLIGRVQQ